MKELLEKYPKATKAVKAYYLEKLMEGLKAELPEEFKAHVREMGIDDERIASIIELNPRAAFDVFDNSNIHIQILPIYKNDDIFEGFNSRIFFIKKIFKNTEVYKTRLEAEKSSLNKAFELLELKLQ